MGRITGILVSLLVIVVLGAVAAGGYYYFLTRSQEDFPEPSPLATQTPKVTATVTPGGFVAQPTPPPTLNIQARLQGIQHDFRANPELVVWGKLEKLDAVSVRIRNPEGPVYEYFFAADDPEITSGGYSRGSGQQISSDISLIAPGDEVSLYLMVDIGAGRVTNITLNEIVP